MTQNSQAIYDFAPLDEYPWRDRLAIRLIDLCCYAVMRVIGSTIRFEVEGRDNYKRADSGPPPIWTFWHEQIFLSAIYFRHRRIAVMVSKSKDGEYISRILNRFGIGTIRGSSTRGGTRALVQMKRSMDEGRAMAFTVDGPKGPCREAKPGPVYLAKLSGGQIVPYHIQARRYWTLRTWDRLQVPKPFTKALLIIGEPILVSPRADEAEIGAKVAETQASLDALVRRAFEWRRDEG